MTRWPLSQLDEFGFAVIEDVIAEETVQHLREAVTNLLNDSATRNRRGNAFARRNLLELPAVFELARSDALQAITHRVLGQDARPVRGILFDKTPDANWTVPWHQDLSIAVTERIDVPGFGPWSIKAGVYHVQPPIDVLHQMLTIRIHLDDCNESSGPLRVIPTSHRKILSKDDLIQRVEAGTQVACTAAAGSAIVMRPLILHALSPANSPNHRRIIHLEYAACDLPQGLKWHASALLRPRP